MPRPHFRESGIVFRVGEIDLRVRHILERGAGELQRRYDPLRDDELGLELDRLPAPLCALGHQRRGGDAIAARLVADCHAGDAGNENEVADRERRRIARRGASFQMRVLEMLDREVLLRDHRQRLHVHVGIGEQQPLLRD
jgi:hypothetical protein